MMPNVNIIVHRKNDPDPALHFDVKEVTMVRLEKMIIVEGGMESGKTSVAFILQDPDGKVLIAETSGALLHGMESALRGFELKLLDEKAG